MLIELLVGFGALIGVLIILAEGTNKPELGAMGALLMVVAAAWILGDGIEYRDGENTTIETIGINTTYNTTYLYQPIPATPYIEAGAFLGLVTILLSMYALLHYAMNIRDTL